MINPEIRKEYGENGERILCGLCNILSEDERNSIYAVAHYTVSEVRGIPLEIVSDRKELVDELSSKIMAYVFGIDKNTIVMCEEYNGEGIKIWHSTQ